MRCGMERMFHPVGSFHLTDPGRSSISKRRGSNVKRQTGRQPMNKKTIRDVEFKGRRVLCRVDFNVPIKDGKVADDTRITSAIPTIKYVLERGASLVLMSHLGRPKGKGYEADFSLKPVAARLQELLGRPVKFGPDCIGAETMAMAKALRPGEVLVVENTRFYADEGKAKVADTATEEEKKAAKAEMKKKQADLAEEAGAPRRRPRSSSTTRSAPRTGRTPRRRSSASSTSRTSPAS